MIKFVNFILQFLFVSIAKFEFQLEKDDSITLEIYINEHERHVNTITHCYGLLGFIKPFNNKDWQYVAKKFAILFMSERRLITEKIKIRKEIKSQEICENCLFYLSKDNSCGRDREMSNLKTFPFKKNMRCFESIE